MSHAQSKQLAAPWQPLGVPPYLRCGKWRTGWCSEGGIGTGDNGKNISSSSPVLSGGWRALRCGLHIRTAAATASQRGTRWGVGGGRCVRDGKRLSVRGAGVYDSITSRRQTAQTGRRQAPVKLRAARWSKRRTVSARLLFRVGGSGCGADWEQDRGSLLPRMGAQWICGAPLQTPLMCLSAN